MVTRKELEDALKSYGKLESGIKDLVHALRNMGLNTVVSCEGHNVNKFPSSHSSLYPFVGIELQKPTDFQSILKSVFEFNKNRNWNAKIMFNFKSFVRVDMVFVSTFLPASQFVADMFAKFLERKRKKAIKIKKGSK